MNTKLIITGAVATASIFIFLAQPISAHSMWEEGRRMEKMGFGENGAQRTQNFQDHWDELQNMSDEGRANLNQERVTRREAREGNREQMLLRKAEFLGISVDDLKTAWEKGVSFLELAIEKGKTQEDMTDFHNEMRSNKINQMVEEGKISQEEGQSLLDRVGSLMRPIWGFFRK